MNKILLVDDDRELTSLLKELLDMEGFNVLVAHDGEQALVSLTTASIYFCST
jgi:two-component system response regulator CpxR